MKNSNLINLTWSLIMATMTFLNACAQSPTDMNRHTTEDNSQSPYFVVLSDSEEDEQLPLKSTYVDVNITGVIADVTIKQVYTNTGKTPIEAIYVFPASTRAAVYNMVMKIDDREIIAIVEEKQKAKNMYNEAKNEGRTASLLEQQRPNVFQMNVANIIPGATVEVHLSYTELLVPEEKTYEFVYPTVVGPRYVSAAETTTEVTETWTNNPYLEEGVAPVSAFDIKVKLNTALPIKEIRCETHKHKINYSSKSIADIQLNEEQGGNRDFVMQYRLAGNTIETGILLYDDPEGETYFLAMFQPPKRIESQMVTKREYVFIVDISGSMSGFPLDVSKSLMNNLLTGLNTHDKFNIVFFAGGSNVYSEESVLANPENIAKAIQFMDNSRGSGGTELLSALKTSMNLNCDDNYSRSFIILTDGYVSVEKQTFDYIRDNLGKANFFSFGIGSSVNRFLIEGMANAGRGEAFIALNKSDAEKQAARFEKYISKPVLTDINFSITGFDVYDMFPKQLPDLFADKPIIITGKYKGSASGNITITGTTGTGAFNQSYPVSNSNNKTNKAIKYLWAREKIRLLCDYNNLRNNNELIEEIVKLGIDYNLLTEFTSFIAIDSEISNPSQKLNTVTQPLPLPQGVSGNAVMHSAPPTHARMAKSEQFMVHEEVDLVVFESEDEDSSDDMIFTMVETMPKFQGGDISSFQKYIQGFIVYPEKARTEGVSGKVFVQFTINEKGKVIDVKIIRGVHPLLDKEVLKALEASPIWVPGEQRGKPVKVNYTIPIVFSLTN